MENEVIDSSEDIIKSLNTINGNCFYRGYTNYDIHMCPQLGRYNKNIRNKEVEMLKKFVELPIFKHIEPKIKNIQQLLEIGQHYGLPTRLLDWTNNSLIALYFALGKQEFNESPLYIAMRYIDSSITNNNWDEINSISDEDNLLHEIDSKRLDELDYCLISDLEKFNPVSSTVLHPLFAEKYTNFLNSSDDFFLMSHSVVPQNDRIIQQEGLFTFHKKIDSPFPKEKIDKIVQINLSINEKYDLSRLLREKYGVYQDSILTIPKPGEDLYPIIKEINVINKSFFK